MTPLSIAAVVPHPARAPKMIQTHAIPSAILITVKYPKSVPSGISGMIWPDTTNAWIPKQMAAINRGALGIGPQDGRVTVICVTSQPALSKVDAQEVR